MTGCATSNVTHARMHLLQVAHTSAQNMHHCRSMSGWSCEEWMDWAENRTAFALYKLEWPAERAHIKAVFDAMWKDLRYLVLHYMRPSPYSGFTETIELARKTGQRYAARAEEVRPLQAPVLIPCRPHHVSHPIPDHYSRLLSRRCP